MSRIVFWPSVALTLTIASASARAEDMRRPTNPEALQHFKAGVAHYNVGHWQLALDEFTQSALVEASPATDFDLAQCHRKLAESPEFEDDPKSKKEHLNLARYHFQRFLRTTQNTPAFEKRANENVASIEAALNKLKQQEDDANPQPQAPVATAAPTTTTTHPIVVGPAPHRRDWFAFGLVVTGGVTIAAGGALYWTANGLRDDANASPDQTERNDLFARADTRTLAAALVGGAGVVIVGAGVLKLLLNSDDAPSANTAWRVSPTSNGIAVFGAF